MIEEFGTIPELETGAHGVAHLLVMLGMVSPKQLAKPERVLMEQIMAGAGKGDKSQKKMTEGTNGNTVKHGKSEKAAEKIDGGKANRH